MSTSLVDDIDIHDITDPALYAGGIPGRISRLADERAYFAAFEQTPIAGAFMHRIHDQEGVWVGAQAAAGVLAPFEDSPAERARILETLKRNRISVIVCCCFADSDPHNNVFACDGIEYVSALLSDGSSEEIALSVPAFLSLFERAWPLVCAALARGDNVLVHCNSGMHRSASVAMALLMALRGETRVAGLARVFSEAVRKRPVIRPTFWPLLESDQFAAICSKLSSRSSGALAVDASESTISESK